MVCTVMQYWPKVMQAISLNIALYSCDLSPINQGNIPGIGKCRKNKSAINQSNLQDISLSVISF